MIIVKAEDFRLMPLFFFLIIRTTDNILSVYNLCGVVREGLSEEVTFELSLES